MTEGLRHWGKIPSPLRMKHWMRRAISFCPAELIRMFIFAIPGSRQKRILELARRRQPQAGSPPCSICPTHIPPCYQQSYFKPSRKTAKQNRSLTLDSMLPPTQLTFSNCAHWQSKGRLHSKSFFLIQHILRPKQFWIMPCCGKHSRKLVTPDAPYASMPKIKRLYSFLPNESEPPSDGTRSRTLTHVLPSARPQPLRVPF